MLDQANGLIDVDQRRAVMGKMQAVIIDEGVTIQPYWRSLYRHFRTGVVGCEMHVAYLPQLYRWGWAA